MSDIITRLQRVAYVMFKDGWPSKDLAVEAGLEILRLRAEIKRLRSQPHPADEGSET